MVTTIISVLTLLIVVEKKNGMDTGVQENMLPFWTLWVQPLIIIGDFTLLFNWLMGSSLIKLIVSQNGVGVDHSQGIKENLNLLVLCLWILQ